MNGACCGACSFSSLSLSLSSDQEQLSVPLATTTPYSPRWRWRLDGALEIGSPPPPPSPPRIQPASDCGRFLVVLEPTAVTSLGPKRPSRRVPSTYLARAAHDAQTNTHTHETHTINTHCCLVAIIVALRCVPYPPPPPLATRSWLGPLSEARGTSVSERRDCSCGVRADP